MLRATCVILLLMSSWATAVEGYKDIYLDREQTIFIHNILCGDLNNLAGLKPAFVYSNSPNIEEGTYYYSTKYGNYSYTFKPIEGQPPALQLRGLLSNGQTQKEQMKIDYCIVAALEGLPSTLSQKLGVVQLPPEDENWVKTMEQYALVAGRPAFANNQFEDPRASASFAQYDEAFYQHNLTILSELETQFQEKSLGYQQTLPEKFKQAVAYAKQEDGATLNKVYPEIPEPAVWTPTSKERYEDLVRIQNQERAFDLVIQENFDWIFSLIQKDSALLRSEVRDVQPAQWVNAQRVQSLKLRSEFDDGTTIILAFDITSEKVNDELFESLETIKEKSNNKRQSLDIQRNEPRKMLSQDKNLDVYSPTEKINLFFSPFRADPTRVKIE